MGHFFIFIGHLIVAATPAARRSLGVRHPHFATTSFISTAVVGVGRMPCTSIAPSLRSLTKHPCSAGRRRVALFTVDLGTRFRTPDQGAGNIKHQDPSRQRLPAAGGRGGRPAPFLCCLVL